VLERTELLSDPSGEHKELGISEHIRSRPVQAALASAGSFATGAATPLLTAIIVPEAKLIPMVTGTSLIFLASLGAFAAHAGGASMMTGALRVTQWGALAMGLPAGVGAIFGTAL
jgi:VIT1/CCC1 family predicted Fe2+/Mn2+ transporter